MVKKEDEKRKLDFDSNESRIEELEHRVKEIQFHLTDTQEKLKRLEKIIYTS